MDGPHQVTTKGDLLTDEKVSSFQLAKVFKDNQRHITSMDYDASGELLLTVSDDDSMRMYDCLTGTLKKTSYSKKYGCAHGRFTHKNTTIIYASTKEDNAIRYLSFHDNKFIRYFKGHSARVTALELSPLEDLFLSASKDGTVKLWDLRSPSCVGSIRTKCERSCITFDPTGLVFTVATNSSEIRLFDVKNYDSGPFSTYTIAQTPNAYPSRDEWISIKANNDGKFLLVSTTGESHIIVDSFSGKVVRKLHGISNNVQIEMEASFTPDGKYVLSGSQDGSIHFWECASGKQVARLEGHAEPCHVVLFNPRYMMFGSADSTLGLWISPFR
ncbi:WD40-repeat-containing domain protein [Zopfochytrium polystomum]|nr:WD40-repeat-containing domain protein [Zopfochytrium polystomum]